MPDLSQKPATAARTPASPQRDTEDGDAADVDTLRPAVASHGGVGASTTSPAAAQLAFGHLAESPTVAPSLEGTLRAARSAIPLGGLVRNAFVPGFRNAVDATDPMAALEFARNVAGSLQTIDDVKTRAADAVARPGQWRICRPGQA